MLKILRRTHSPLPRGPGTRRPTLGPGKASFCFNFTVSSMYPEQLPICKGGFGGSSWEARRYRRRGVKKMTPEMARDRVGQRRQGPGGQGLEVTGDPRRPTCGGSSSKRRRTPASCSSLCRKAGGWCTSTGGAWLGSRTASSQYSSLGVEGQPVPRAHRPGALSPHSSPS